MNKLGTAVERSGNFVAPVRPIQLENDVHLLSRWRPSSFAAGISFGGFRRRTGAGSVSVALVIHVPRTSGITYIRQYHYKAIDENLLHYALSPAEVRQKFTTSSFLKSDNRL